jgi:two-component system chemotaxis sensor kinase CheA
LDLRRFVDLYASETQEHLRLLNRGILDMESGDAAHAIGEAFRAAHTIKGLSAAMGYGAVTELAHALEDRLATVRASTQLVDIAMIDALLGAADRLEQSIAVAIAAGPPQPLPPQDESVPPVTGPTTAATQEVTAPLPRSRRGERSVRVRIRPDAPLKAARGVLVVRNVDRLGALRAYEPAEFDEAFDGVLTLVLAVEQNEVEVEAAIRAAGDVATIEWGGTEPSAPAASPTESIAAPEPAAAAVRTAQLRVDASRLDDLANGIGEASVVHARLREALAGTGTLRTGAPLADRVDRLGVLLGELQHTILSMRMVPVREVFDRFPRLIRDAARSLDKRIDFRIEGADIELDRSILDEMMDPLVHLLRNAVDHGIEAPAVREAAGKPVRGVLTLRAERERTSVRIQVIDDGRGIAREPVIEKARALGLSHAATASDLSDDELFRLLSQPGFSTADQVTEVSGRGVGLDAVVARIRALGGAIVLTTQAGEGTTFTIRLPLTLALAQALRVRVGGEDYAIPLTHVTEAVELNDVMMAAVRGRESVRLREELLPLVRMRAMLRADRPGEEKAAVIAEIADRRVALAVDELVGREQILVKTFDAAAGMLPYFSGATILADGKPALILDPLSVV